MSILQTARSVARSAFHGADRIAHPIRRRRVLRELAQRGWPGTVLFVCHGNICRSPYAAAAFARALATGAHSDVRVGSAGFIGPNRPAPAESQIVAARRGLDLSAHLSAQFSRQVLNAADLIVVMNAEQQRALVELFGCEAGRVIVLGDLDPLPIEKRAIRDPIGESEEVFEESYGRIDRCLESLIAALNEAVPSTQPDQFARSA